MAYLLQIFWSVAGSWLAACAPPHTAPSELPGQHADGMSFSVSQHSPSAGHQQLPHAVLVHCLAPPMETTNSVTLYNRSNQCRLMKQHSPDWQQIEPSMLCLASGGTHVLHVHCPEHGSLRLHTTKFVWEEDIYNKEQANLALLLCTTQG